jgi:hypothetical protein
MIGILRLGNGAGQKLLYLGTDLLIEILRWVMS